MFHLEKFLVLSSRFPHSTKWTILSSISSDLTMKQMSKNLDSGEWSSPKRANSWLLLTGLRNNDCLDCALQWLIFLNLKNLALIQKLEWRQKIMVFFKGTFKDAIKHFDLCEEALSSIFTNLHAIQHRHLRTAKHFCKWSCLQFHLFSCIA